MENKRGMKRKAEDDSQSVLYGAPREINVIEYAQQRAAEIQALAKAVKKTKESIFINAQMPRHMRRRAMSHNVKRIPRRLRECAKDVLNTTKSKRPSRKHRRRPKNLLEEYQRRQRRHVWLETHIWHAKRFKMENKWGYRIPIHPTNKSNRAAYRASQHSCQLSDVSYLCCIEIRGPEKSILSGLDHLTNPSTGLSFGAKMYIDGSREGQIVLYQYDKYPQNVIGPVTFMWRPVTETDKAHKLARQLWIWVHPSSFTTVWTELLNLFKSSEESDVVNISTEIKLDNDSEVEKKMEMDSETDGQKLDSKNIDSANSGPNHNSVQNIAYKIGSIEIESLKDRLVRHRLNGPLSQCVLASSIKPANILPTDNGDDHWWNSYYDNKVEAIAATQQTEFWESVCKCQSPGEATPNCLVGLTVRDPRIIRLKQRTKVVPDPKDSASDLGVCKEIVTSDIASSAIWDATVREKVKSTKMADYKLNQLQSEQLVPGCELHLGAEESRIPVLLVQKPGVMYNPGTRHSNTSNNYGSGWDVIIPSGWSMAFWITFVYHGARAGGLRESENLAKEKLQLHFPACYPDSEAARVDEEEVYSELQNNHYKRPPAKRPNYIKLGIKSPFKCQWQQLVNEWIEIHKGKMTDITKDSTENDGKDKQEQTFYVLRDTAFLNHLGAYLSCVQLQTQKICGSDEAFDTQKAIQCHSQAVVVVQLRMVSKGFPEDFAIICLPTKEDMQKFREDKNFAGPVEEQHIDEQQLKVKEEKRKLKKLKDCDKFGKGSKVNLKSLEAAGSEYATANESDVVKFCTRDTIGYLRHGVYMLSSGKGGGIGFCSVVGLMELLQHCLVDGQCVVLVRNPKSYQYRYAFLSILE